MAVKVDIPGVGEIVAENAASEATLQEILKAIKGQSSGSGSGGGAQGANAQLQNLGKTTKKNAGLMGKLGAGAGKVVGGFAKLAKGGLAVVSIFAKVGDQASAMIANIANLDNSVSGAAKSIPIFGSTFGRVAEASEKMVNAVQAASSSGASFGGQIQNVTRAAANAGMTLDQYTKFVQANADSFRLLGGDVETGRKRFEALSRDMRQSGMMEQLNMLGFTSEQVNTSMGKYTKILGRTGKLQNMTTSEIAMRSANYMKEIDKLAKATGQERETIEENQAKLLRDAQFQAKVANLGVDQADALRNTITGLPEGLQGVAKDIIATGTATTKESEEFAALMPRSAALMQKFAQITESGGTITAAMQQELQNTMSAEGKERKVQYRTQGIYNAELADSYMNIVDASNIQQDALKKGAESQNAQIAANDGAVASMEKMRRRINEISLEFMNFLQASGLLDSMMTAFELLTSVIRTVVFPVFEVFGMILKPLIAVIANVLQPALDVLGALLNNIVMPIFRFLGNILNGVVTVFGNLYDILILHVMKAFNEVVYHLQKFFQPAIDFFSRMLSGVGNFMQDYFVPAIKTVGNFFSWVGGKLGDFGALIADTLSPVFDTLAWVASPVVDLFEMIGNQWSRMKSVFDMFNSLGDVAALMKMSFAQLGIAFKKMKLWVDETIDVWETEEDKAEFERRRAEIAREQAELNEKKQELGQKLVLQAQENQKKREDAQKKRDEEHQDSQAEIDALIEKNANATWENIGKIGSNATLQQTDYIQRNLSEATTQGIEEFNKAAGLNMGDSVGMLTDFAQQQNSYLVPDKQSSMSTVGTNNASAITPTKTGDEGGGSANATPSTTPTTTTAAATKNEAENPLVTLNNNIGLLINLTRQSVALQKQELAATKMITGDAFNL